MSISQLYNIREAIREDKRADWVPQPGTARSAGSDRVCAFCHARTASYTCPTCNAPYCSLSCFRSKPHESCATPFATRSLRAALDADEGGGRAGQGEREKMMRVLARFEKGEIGEEEMMQGMEEEMDDGEDEEELPEVGDIDIESATPEQLLALLSPSERARFESALSDPQRAGALLEQRSSALGGPSKQRESEPQIKDEQMATSLEGEAGAENAMPEDRVLAEEEEEGPWWTRGGAPESSAASTLNPEATEGSSGTSHAPVLSPGFLHALGTLLGNTEHGAESNASQGPDLSYNIIALLLAYAYTLRHLDIPSLSSILPSTPATNPTGLGSKSKFSSEQRTASPSRGPTKIGPSDPSSSANMVAAADESEFESDSDEDEEMPPLEPDGPDPPPPLPTPRSAHLKRAMPAPLTEGPQRDSNESGDRKGDTLEESKARSEADEEVEELRALARATLEQLVPFLSVNPVPPKRAGRSKSASGKRAGAPDVGDKGSKVEMEGAMEMEMEKQRELSRTLLSSVEDAGLWILARLGTDQTHQPAALLTLLLRDADTLLRPRRVVSAAAATELSAHLPPSYTHEAQEREDVLRALSDLYEFFGPSRPSTDTPTPTSTPKTTSISIPAPSPSAAAQHKLLFYARFHLHTPRSTLETRLLSGPRGIEKEIARLAKDLDADEMADMYAAVGRAGAGWRCG